MTIKDLPSRNSILAEDQLPPGTREARAPGVCGGIVVAAQEALGSGERSIPESDRLDSYSGPSPKRMLIVDDSDDDAFFIQQAVRRSRFPIQVDRATNGAEARSIINDSQPSLITLDIDLPDVCGLALLSEFRSRSFLRATPIVMISGSESNEDVERAFSFGANGFLIKTTGFEEYVDSVGVILDYWLGLSLSTLREGGGQSHSYDQIAGPGAFLRKA